jgi:4-hydroxy-tetrahydrodipicolinate synthase
LASSGVVKDRHWPLYHRGFRLLTGKKNTRVAGQGLSLSQQQATIAAKPLKHSVWRYTMIRGSLVALVTPMTQQGDVDWPALDRLIDFHLDNATDGIVAAGTTGEPSTLSFEEHFEVIRRVVTRVNGKIPVIAGTGSNSTREAIELTRYASEVGADYCLITTPYYNKPTQEGLFLHYKAIAEASQLPIILYNVPGRTAVDMHNETVVRLSKLDKIVALKDATGRYGLQAFLW